MAVTSFDSRLKLWHDFSRDRGELESVVERALRFSGQPLLRPSRSHSLIRSFPFREAKKAATPERALRLVGDALREIPGEKILLYVGWGLGRYGRGGVRMTPEYEPALAALNAAKTSVFVLDVTDADYHSLEVGIRQVAADTGGTYAKTNHFAKREVMRLTETISGYYLLSLDPSQMPANPGKVKIELREKKGTVLTRAG